jgi:hypothetical protein
MRGAARMLARLRTAGTPEHEGRHDWFSEALGSRRVLETHFGGLVQHACGLGWRSDSVTC